MKKVEQLISAITAVAVKEDSVARVINAVSPAAGVIEADEFEKAVGGMPRSARPAWGAVAITTAVLRVGAEEVRKIWAEIEDHRAPWPVKISALAKVAKEGGGADAALAELNKWQPKEENHGEKVRKAIAALREAMQEAGLIDDGAERALRSLAAKIEAPAKSTTKAKAA